MSGQTFIRVSPEDFDLSEETSRIRAANPQTGAIVSFVGVVRNRNDGSDVAAMSLEHYPGMTEKALGAIIKSARARWSIDDVTVIHRVGDLAVGDQIVLALVSSAHRREAFEACEFIMDWLKTEAPFWKKEKTPEGDRWVDARESDDVARDRWGTRL